MTYTLGDTNADIYQENILDAANNKKHIAGQEFLNEYFSNNTKYKKYKIGRAKNVSCGDSGSIFILLNDGDIVSDVKINSDGCAISKAGLHFLAEYIMGKNMAELKIITPANIYNMFKINIGPMRAPCAMLCYNALEEMLKNSQN